MNFLSLKKKNWIWVCFCLTVNIVTSRWRQPRWSTYTISWGWLVVQNLIQVILHLCVFVLCPQASHWPVCWRISRRSISSWRRTFPCPTRPAVYCSAFPSVWERWVTAATALTSNSVSKTVSHLSYAVSVNSSSCCQVTGVYVTNNSDE